MSEFDKRARAVELALRVREFERSAPVKGDRGDVGPVGPPGPEGRQGERGAQGDSGPTGPRGIQGERGGPGERGEQGIQGPEGQRGETGPQGDQGVRGDVGPVGPVGPQGERGTDGAAGTRGETGEQGTKGEGFTWRGEWHGGTAYVARDVVQHLGSSWVALRPSSGLAPAPGSGDWDLMAKRGSDGWGSVTAEGGGASTAADVEVTPAGNIESTDAQAALEELDAAITAHVHAASSVTVAPAGNLAAVTVQAAVEELQTDVDTRATSAALTTHAALTVAHGATGAVVGTTNTQTLSGKTFSDVVNSTVASGSDAVKFSTSGARLHLGTGSLDYFYSDGTRIVTPGDLNVTGTAYMGSTVQRSGVGTLIIIGTSQEGGAQTATKIDTFFTLANAASKIVDFANGGTGKSNIAIDGTFNAYTTGAGVNLPGAQKIRNDSAAPTTGTWAVGDIVFNTAPTAGGFIGWVCTTAGTPGTWKTWGAISA